MVVANHLRAAKREQAAERLADHGRAQVADVHLLRGVGRRVVDDPRLPGEHGGGADAEVFLGVVGGEPVLQRGGREAEIDEARAGDFDRADFGRQRDQADELGGEGARVLLLALGVGENAVGLEIAVRRIGGADVGREEREVEAGLGGGGFHGVLDLGGDVEGQNHPRTQRPARGAIKTAFHSGGRGLRRIAVLGNIILDKLLAICLLATAWVEGPGRLNSAQTS